MNIPDYLPLFVGPAFGVIVMIVIGAILLRDRWKARHTQHLHPGE